MTRNSFDLTRGCRTGHWDLTTWRNFAIKTLHQKCYNKREEMKITIDE
jgi:hypothetical protein